MIFRRIIYRLGFNLVGRLKELRFMTVNRHNRTRLHGMNYPNFDDKKVTVGKLTYGTINVYMFGNDKEQLRIGSYCSIGPECIFLLSGEHNTNTITTFPIEKSIRNKANPPKCKGPIVIDDDVWVGYGVTILSGVHIGKGAVVGACSVVTKDVPEYSIVAGNPARIIKMRFSQEIIEKLKNLDLQAVDEKRIAEVDSIKLDEQNIDELIRLLVNNTPQ